MCVGPNKGNHSPWAFSLLQIKSPHNFNNVNVIVSCARPTWIPPALPSGICHVKRGKTQFYVYYVNNWLERWIFCDCHGSVVHHRIFDELDFLSLIYMLCQEQTKITPSFFTVNTFGFLSKSSVLFFYIHMPCNIIKNLTHHPEFYKT